MRGFISLSAFLIIVSMACGHQAPGFTDNRLVRSGEADFDGLMVLYGDPHVHTNISDGDESPDYALRYARDVADLDWCCLTDHSDIMMQDSWATEDYYRSLPDRYSVDGKFSVLFGYEWTSPYYGHRNVYSVDTSIPILSARYDIDTDGIDELWNQLKLYDVITIPHHPLMPTSTKYWWEVKNPDVEVAVEFYSKWGNSLYMGVDRQILNADPLNGIYDALSIHGLKLGIMAGSDTHMSRPDCYQRESRGDYKLEYPQPGITGVWATANTREEIFEAMKNRHTYGMSGTKVMVEFSVDGNIMGSEYSSDTPPEIRLIIDSPVQISNIMINKIHGDAIEEFKSFDLEQEEFSVLVTDEIFIEDSAYFSVVTLENGDMAVTSPVWVDFVHTGDGVVY